MAGITPETRISDILDNSEARAVLQSAVPGLLNSPMIGQLRNIPVGVVVGTDRELSGNSARLERLWLDLGAVEDTTAPRVEPEVIHPDRDYESSEVPTASATVHVPATAETGRRLEITIMGPSHGNPYVDVELHATFSGPDGELRVGGFYDGAGRYLVRFLAPVPGVWSFITTSTARSLDGLSGSVDVAAGNRPGPVRVADRYHFAHADGSVYRPIGTTLYAWTHQTEELQEQTLAALASSPFTKVRMGLFPKAYLYNTNEPDSFVFPRNDVGGFDQERFDPEYFAHLERRIDELADLGIEADLILFHPYDRWGFSDLRAAVDERYLRYAVRRLSSFANVWWSMANEYDLLWAKTEQDWERLAALVVDEDPYDHLISIHNCFAFYDYSRPWITHSSVQRTDVYRTAENVDAWREQWGKPVVVDEVAYEGDLDQGWGNITGEELVRRFWEGTLRGGYLTHGETFFADDEVIWWAKGGRLKGDSTARIAFLSRIMAESPTGRIDPLPSDWDAPWGGVAGRQMIVYFGFNRPSFRTLSLPVGMRVRAEIIDTWNMTVEPIDGIHEGSVRIELPARQFMAVRMTAVDD